MMLPSISLAIALAMSSTRGASLDSTRVNDYLAYDAARRTAWLTIAAAHDGDNGGMSFNGAHAGAKTITVPRGWTVAATFVNEDPQMPHSAVVIKQADPPPMAPVPPAFKGAATKDADSGFPENGRDTFRFTADAPGDYLIFCGVAGHAQMGMWIRLVVSPTATKPSYS